MLLRSQQDFQRASIELSSAVTNILDSDFGGKVTDLIALPTQILADVAGGINSATMPSFFQDIGLEEGPEDLLLYKWEVEQVNLLLCPQQQDLQV